MKEPIRKIGFLVDKREIDLLQEACIYGADADEILEKAVKEGKIWFFRLKCNGIDVRC